MSDYQPKVGDKVMVGEHGPYTVNALSDEDSGYVQIEIPTEMPRRYRSVLPDWLTPAPEPDKPTAPGALARDGRGELLFCSPFMGTSRWYEINTPGGGYWTWDEITRPITVLLADPAEVETLQAEIDGLRAERDEARFKAREFKRERDELQRRIDQAQMLVDDPGYWSTYSQTRPMMNSILRGES